MTEILTKEIGTNQIAASFNKVKEYYLFSKENKESILKAVENEFFDGYSFQDVKDYYKNMADEKVEEIKKNYGYDITIVRDYIINNPGVVEKIQSIEGLKNIYKNITEDEAADIFYKSILRNMKIKSTSDDYLSKIRNQLNENLNLYLNTYCEDSDIDEFKEMIRFFIKHESFSNFFFNNWDDMIIINPNSLQYKIYREENETFDTLKVNTLHLKVDCNSREYKLLLSLLKEFGVSNDEMDCYLKHFSKFILSLVKKNTFKASTYNSFSSRNKIFEQVEYFIEIKLELFFDSCLFNSFLMPGSIFFDSKDCALIEHNFDSNDYIRIVVTKNNIITGFDFWNAEETDLKNKMFDSIKKSLELSIEGLLKNNFSFDDVIADRIPISFLTDLEIIEDLRSFDEPPLLLFSKTQTKIKRKDQLVRLTLLLKDVMIENLENIT